MKKISKILLAILFRGMDKIKKISALFAIMGILGLISPLSSSALLIEFSEPSGLSATADFALTNDDGSGNYWGLEIVLTNTSTGLPLSFYDGNLSSNQLLTSIAFDLPDLIEIGGGSVTVTAGSITVNFIAGLDWDISPEWGFGNEENTGFGGLYNFVSTNTAHATKFATGNLTGPDVLDGPQGGLTNGLESVGKLGAVQNSITITLDLNGGITDLSFLDNGVIVEFGSDAAFVPVSEPSTLLLIGSGLIGLAVVGRRKFRKT